MLKILIVRSKDEDKHIASYTTEKMKSQFPVFCEQVISSEDIRAIITTLQSYLASEASHAIVCLSQTE